jgi:hypothetical protein
MPCLIFFLTTLICLTLQAATASTFDDLSEDDKVHMTFQYFPSVQEVVETTNKTIRKALCDSDGEEVGQRVDAFFARLNCDDYQIQVKNLWFIYNQPSSEESQIPDFLHFSYVLIEAKSSQETLSMIDEFPLNRLAANPNRYKKEDFIKMLRTWVNKGFEKHQLDPSLHHIFNETT